MFNNKKTKGPSAKSSGGAFFVSLAPLIRWYWRTIINESAL